MCSSAKAGRASAALSRYWGFGGHWLLRTLGVKLVRQFSGIAWLLLVIGAAKLAGALVPAWLDTQGWLASRLWRRVIGAGAVVLVAWGGLNSLIGNVVLAGVYRRSGGFDRDAMIGHAWLWDPLFLIWE